MSYDKDAIKDAVKEHYENLARESLSVKGDAEKITASIGYAAQDLAGIPKEADLGLGCGNPQEAAKPRLNETVLDLGCGRGLDCFIASKAVGKDGKVFGLDSSKTMVSRASEIALKNGFTNCEFILGEIEHIPLPDNSLDLVMSNCVINLSTDKYSVYSEIYRCLRKGGRAAISDITLKRALPCEWVSDPDMVKT
jgi:ribosomal protein L11 methyltransferase (prmA)